MRQFKKKRAGIDPLMAAEWNDMVKIVKGMRMSVAPPLRMLQTPHGTSLTMAPPTKNFFVAKIVDEGPSAEANYTDQRYWVKEQMIANGAGDPDTTDLIWVDNNRDDAIWVTATNMAEVLSETHFILDDNSYRVLVWRTWDFSPVARYCFYSLGDYELGVTDAHDVEPVPVNQALDPTETADTVTWPRDDQPADKDGVDLPVITRLVYREDSAEVLYQFHRVLTFDASGRLFNIGTEVKTIVSTPGLCS